MAKSSPFSISLLSWGCAGYLSGFQLHTLVVLSVSLSLLLFSLSISLLLFNHLSHDLPLRAHSDLVSLTVSLSAKAKEIGNGYTCSDASHANVHVIPTFQMSFSDGSSLFPCCN